MSTVTVPNSFFQRELQNYSHWPSAFWRELVQNSVDAGAKRIEVKIEEIGPCCRIKFRDDGPGMDEATLRDVYFVLGASTKTEPSSIGGFGRARMLTCFAHDRFEILTRDQYCNGCGGQYTIEKSGSFLRGCEVIVEMSRSAFDMERILCSYLAMCHLQLAIFVNGKRFVDWAHRYRKMVSLSFGDLLVNKSRSNTGILVRVNGVHMFSRHIRSPHSMVLAIEPSRSREILTSNRDGMVEDSSRELDQLISSLAGEADPFGSIDDENEEEVFGSEVFEELSDVSPHSRPAAKNNPLGNSIDHRLNTISLAAGAGPSTNSKPNLADAVYPQTAQFGSSNRSEAPSSLGVESLKPSPALLEDGGEHSQRSVVLDVCIKLETPSTPAKTTSSQTPPAHPPYVLACPSKNKKLRRAVNAYRPDKLGNGVRRRLLDRWTHYCRIAIQELRFLRPGIGSVRYLTGFLFSEEDNAGWRRKNNLNILMVCPVNAEGRLRYRLGSKKDMDRLLIAACHEASHIAVGWHNEDFAILFTELVAAVLSRVTRRRQNRAV